MLIRQSVFRDSRKFRKAFRFFFEAIIVSYLMAKKVKGINWGLKKIEDDITYYKTSKGWTSLKELSRG